MSMSLPALLAGTRVCFKPRTKPPARPLQGRDAWDFMEAVWEQASEKDLTTK